MSYTHFNRTAAMILAGAMMLSCTSCALLEGLSGPNKQEIIDAADDFASALLKKDPDKILKLTNEKDLGAFSDLFEEDNYSDEENKFFDAVGDTISYEIDEDSVEADKEEASIDVVFTMVDYEKVLKDGDYSDIDEVLDIIEDSDDMEEITVTFEFEKDDDEWLLTNFKDKEFGMLFFYYTYELSLTPDLASLIYDSDCWSGSAYSIYSEVYFSEDITAYDIVFDVYCDGALIAADQPAAYYETYIYCDYYDPDYNNLPVGEYSIVVKCEGSEIITLTTTIDTYSDPEPTETESGIDYNFDVDATGELADYVVAVDWWADDGQYCYSSAYGIEYDIYFTDDVTWDELQEIMYVVYDAEGNVYVDGVYVSSDRTNCDDGWVNDEGYYYIYVGYVASDYLEPGTYYVDVYNPDGQMMIHDCCDVF